MAHQLINVRVNAYNLGKLLKFSGLHAGLDWDKTIGPGIFWSRRPTTAYDIAYTTIQKFLNSKIFNIFLVSSAHQPCIYNPKSEKVGTVWKTQIKKESNLIENNESL